MKIAINGFGRIGRNILRSYLAKDQVWKKFNQIEIVAINDLGSPKDSAHLLKYDSVHGRLNNQIEHTEDSIQIDGQKIACFSERDPKNLPWTKLGIDIVFECTGLFTSREAAGAHLDAGAKRVLISAPGKDVDKTVVFGVNHETLTKDDLIISNASCTTNCLAPLAKVINEHYTITNGMANTIHAYTNDQSLLDVHHSDLLRARAANLSMIPTKTGAASAVGEVLPELLGKLDGLAVSLFTSREAAGAHLDAGAKRVLISAPGKDVDKTVVFGVNHETLTKDDLIISNASCTTNCLAPLAKVINEHYTITNGMANTIHAYTNDQSLLDVHHSDLLRARAANLSMIPTKTGAASAVGEVLPELLGKLDGLAVRVPVSNVSLLDFTFTTEKSFSIEDLNSKLEAATKNGLSGILAVNEIPLVSTDFGNDSHSVIYDKSHTKQIGNSTKILAWYDNEWGFSNRMLDVANYLNQITNKEFRAA